MGEETTNFIICSSSSTESRPSTDSLNQSESNENVNEKSDNIDCFVDGSVEINAEKKATDKKNIAGEKPAIDVTDELDTALPNSINVEKDDAKSGDGDLKLSEKLKHVQDDEEIEVIVGSCLTTKDSTSSETVIVEDNKNDESTNLSKFGDVSSNIPPSRGGEEDDLSSVCCDSDTVSTSKEAENIKTEIRRSQRKITKRRRSSGTGLNSETFSSSGSKTHIRGGVPNVSGDMGVESCYQTDQDDTEEEGEEVVGNVVGDREDEEGEYCDEILTEEDVSQDENEIQDGLEDTKQKSRGVSDSSPTTKRHTSLKRTLRSKSVNSSRKTTKSLDHLSIANVNNVNKKCKNGNSKKKVPNTSSKQSTATGSKKSHKKGKGKVVKMANSEMKIIDRDECAPSGPKGRRHIFKKDVYKSPASIPRIVTSDHVVYQGEYFQVGDIVSVIDVDNHKKYYAQLRGFLTDQYCESSAVITWLLPTKMDDFEVNETILQFDPSKFVVGYEEEVPRPLECFEFVMHAPHDYFKKYKNSPHETLRDASYRTFSTAAANKSSISDVLLTRHAPRLRH